MQRFFSLIFLLFLTNSVNAATFSTNNVDAEFDVCMDAWKTGNVIWQLGETDSTGVNVRVFVHKNDRIFDIQFLRSKGLYQCREKMFYIKEPPEENEQPKSATVKETPLDYDGYNFICNKNSLLSFTDICNGKRSDETILSLQQVLSEGTLVRIKGQTLFNSASGYSVEGFFLPIKESLQASLMGRTNRIACTASKGEQENVQALANLKEGQTYTITGNVNLVTKKELQLVNCRFQLE